MMGRGAPFDNLNWMDDGKIHEADYDLDAPSGHDGNLINVYNLLDSADDDIITITSQDNNEPAEEPAEEVNSPPIIPSNERAANNDVSAKTAKKDSKEKLRPKRNPKGHRFRGWMHPQEFNIWSQQTDADDKNEDNDSINTADTANNNDRGAWWRSNSRCFEIDYICHRRQSNQWAYMTPNNNWKHHQEVVFQPTMELKPSAWKYDGGRYNAELNITIKVDSPTRAKMRDDSFAFEFEQCQLSTTDTHVVLQSVFNDMVGEFYSRSLLGLYQTMMMGVQQQQQQDDDGNGQEGTAPALMPWEQDIQFYIHIPLKNKQVLDGHKLLTAGMLSNPNTGMAVPFLDLFQPPPLPKEEDEGQDGQIHDDDDDDCQCYRKMVFCGYDVYTHDEEVNSEDIDTVEEYDDRKTKRQNEVDEVEVEEGTENDYSANNEDEQEEAQTTNTNTDTELALLSDDNPSPSSSFNPNLKYTLWSAGTVSPYDDKHTNKDKEEQGDSDVPTRYCIKGEECQGYANLRNLMSSNFVKHYPTLGDDIVKFRREALLTKGLISSNDYSGDTKEWLVVGLTQRTYRRAWLNLATVMQQCNTKLNDRSVVFIKVNVEDTSSPYEQLILHRSLDVLIGVHGAQLTQAVVLPPHAHVLELLPWVPSYIRGAWVTRRNAPTPLGIIYHNTDLNHAGFSLDRTSTDLCVGVGDVGSEEEKECFLDRERRKMFIWDNRDFNVEPEVILTYVEKLVLFMRDDEMGKLCGQVKDRLDERFVLYNVWCAEDEGEGEEESSASLSVSHYYTDKAPPSEGEHNGLGERKRHEQAS